MTALADFIDMELGVSTKFLSRDLAALVRLHD
jgi:hypothetical protein